jgi:hypothetical protein
VTSDAQLAPGTRLVSASCSTQLIVVRAPVFSVHITCGSTAMAILGATEARPLASGPPESAGVEHGKRYRDPESGLEVLCTQSGAGPIEVDGRPLQLAHF